ncbi:TonB-dependent SusC/RagA subfamily outer membrane receptor [Jejuia pallidilutea]|uniref:TonB-dependent SusC/RagA subfamily outer membrane receptor n=1 Tax=Jejuia pallidilutea TaxID=504487 RepID=A0A362XGU8_9FLAO|nr:TonB-dependent receptor plug domain-containing protein [Jejuia pallidilutea]PQV51532.1 TonB-dependent SusC/RagA subfamily outer membrane receptor [Jejuia pallidilutea]
MKEILFRILKHDVDSYCRCMATAFMFFAFLVNINAQEKIVTGIVTEPSDLPLPGTTVVEKGTSNGEQTDFDGAYSIDVDNSSVLVFSYVVYVSKELVVSGQTTINVQLEKDIQQLNEVVIVGYRTQTKRENSVAILTIKSNQIREISAPIFEQALQGIVSGLQIKTSGGAPDTASRIQIRGINSITAITESLVLIDCIPVLTGAFNTTINSQDIESLTVLKDASVTAIYGSRCVSGVVLITTKSCKSGKSTFGFNIEPGINSPINMVELANSPQWRGVIKQALTNDGLPNPKPLGPLLFDLRQLSRFESLNIYQNTNNDWVNQMINTSMYQQYFFTASQGGEKPSYYVFGQYRGQESNCLGGNFQRYEKVQDPAFKNDYVDDYNV